MLFIHIIIIYKVPVCIKLAEVENEKTFFLMNKSRDAAVKKNRYKRSRDK